jgi:E3 ubiquitin-protein transferase RMND5
VQDEAASAGAGARNTAMLYARAHLASFAGDPAKMAEIRRLMGSLLYAGRLEASPYTDLLAPEQWANVQKDFVRVCCAALGQAQDSPLAVAVKVRRAAVLKIHF